MNNEQYPLKADVSQMEFWFVSSGPKGNIKKKVIFTLASDQLSMVYNLGFGDVDELTGDLNDLSTSNNGDRDKVLATVAATVLKFTARFPKALVYAKGSTQSRTRLYQMGLTSKLEEISSVLEVRGLFDDKWVKFEKNVNYEAFMVYRK